MGKFAGFLKRMKNFASNVVNKVAKGVKWLKETSRKYYIEPMNNILTSVLPQVKPISDALFAVDNKIIDGMNWIIDKTNNNSKSDYKNKIYPMLINNNPRPMSYLDILPKQYHYPNPNGVEHI